MVNRKNAIKTPTCMSGVSRKMQKTTWKLLGFFMQLHQKYPKKAVFWMNQTLSSASHPIRIPWSTCPAHQLFNQPRLTNFRFSRAHSMKYPTAKFPCFALIMVCCFL